MLSIFLSLQLGHLLLILLVYFTLHSIDLSCLALCVPVQFVYLFVKFVYLIRIYLSLMHDLLVLFRYFLVEGVYFLGILAQQPFKSFYLLFQCLYLLFLDSHSSTLVLYNLFVFGYFIIPVFYDLICLVFRVLMFFELFLKSGQKSCLLNNTVLLSLEL